MQDTFARATHSAKRLNKRDDRVSCIQKIKFMPVLLLYQKVNQNFKNISIINFHKRAKSELKRIRDRSYLMLSKNQPF